MPVHRPLVVVGLPLIPVLHLQRSIRFYLQRLTCGTKIPVATQHVALQRVMMVAGKGLVTCDIILHAVACTHQIG